MRNYSLAKLELLALKWAVTEKLWDYLLGSKFMVYTDNNPLAYTRESKLGVVQIRWLNKLVLFDLYIKYITGRLNKVADALSHHPINSEEMDSNPESEEYETIMRLRLDHVFFFFSLVLNLVPTLESIHSNQN